MNRRSLKLRPYVLHELTPCKTTRTTTQMKNAGRTAAGRFWTTVDGSAQVSLCDTSSGQKNTLLGHLLPEVSIRAAHCVPEASGTVDTVERAVVVVMPSRTPAEWRNVKRREGELIA